MMFSPSQFKFSGSKIIFLRRIFSNDPRQLFFFPSFWGLFDVDFLYPSYFSFIYLFFQSCNFNEELNILRRVHGSQSDSPFSWGEEILLLYFLIPVQKIMRFYVQLAFRLVLISLNKALSTWISRKRVSPDICWVHFKLYLSFYFYCELLVFCRPHVEGIDVIIILILIGKCFESDTL